MFVAWRTVSRSCIAGFGFANATAAPIINRGGFAQCFLIVHTIKLLPISFDLSVVDADTIYDDQELGQIKTIFA
jgi:hypothetical protein